MALLRGRHVAAHERDSASWKSIRHRTPSIGRRSMSSASLSKLGGELRSPCTAAMCPTHASCHAGRVVDAATNHQ
jgi:hypothetical protein